jgi:hypothetical protein
MGGHMGRRLHLISLRNSNSNSAAGKSYVMVRVLQRCLTV